MLLGETLEKNQQGPHKFHRLNLWVAFSRLRGTVFQKKKMFG